MRDVRNIMLLLLSLGLVTTWIYHLYDKTRYSHRRTEVYIRDSAAVADGIRDSLKKIYSETINVLDTRIDSSRNSADSLKTKLDSKLKEIYQLKSEVTVILRNRNATKADLLVARKKIGELQQIIEELRKKNRLMDEEKKQLAKVLEQLNNEMKDYEQNMQRLSQQNKDLSEKVNIAALFVASEIRFEAIQKKLTKEQETSLAKKTHKLVVSFVVQNNISPYTNAEVVIMIIGPDGQVLQIPMLEPGTFDTKNEGKKIFTQKIKFDYNKGEQKTLSFSIHLGRFIKGNYTLQIWHNGIMIGQKNKTLN